MWWSCSVTGPNCALSIRGPSGSGSSPTEVDGRGVPCELAHFGRDPLLEGLPTAYLAARLARPPCPAQGPAHRPAPGRRHREHLRGRDLLSGKAQARPLRWLANAARGRLLSPRPPGRCCARRWLCGGRRCGTSAIVISRAIWAPTRDSHAVYDRAGEPCRRCGNRVARIKIGARSAYLCEGCQF